LLNNVLATAQPVVGNWIDDAAPLDVKANYLGALGEWLATKLFHDRSGGSRQEQKLWGEPRDADTYLSVDEVQRHC